MQKKYQKHVLLLKVKIVSTPKSELIRKIIKNTTNKRRFLIVTPNPEQLVLASRDDRFKKILNKAEISVPDAVGLAAAAEYLSLPNPKNMVIRFPVLLFQGILVGLAIIFAREKLESQIKVVKGRDLFLDLIRLANRRKWKVVFVGDRFGSAEKAANKLRISYKGIKIYTLEGPNLDSDGVPVNSEEEELEHEVIEKINRVSPELMFVGFGAPKQEKWSRRWQPYLKVIGTMVVGGTFDYISEKRKRTPKIFENIGLEWFWRLITGSQKISRILSAIITFPWRIFVTKLRM